jgi:rubrerythrin
VATCKKQQSGDENMNVFDFAIKMELDGKDYYEMLAKKAEQTGLKNIFTGLAEDEQKHYEIFQELKSTGGTPVMSESGILDVAKNIFAELPTGETTLSRVGGNLQAYQHAMKLESESIRIYEEAAAKEHDPAIKALLLKVADEERKHFNILGNIYNFVNAPNQSLAWGEFSNLEEFDQFSRDIDS